jgi:hypothetical protein
MFRKPDPKGIFMPPIEIVELPGKGYSCMATKEIQQGELVERCITLKFELTALNEMFRLLEGRTIFHDYVFTHDGYAYIAMGFGGVYNHADQPNCRWRLKDLDNGRPVLEIRSLKKINAGEEITIKYILDSSRLWFDQPEE